jgi:hypothetical protein
MEGYLPSEHPRKRPDPMIDCPPGTPFDQTDEYEKKPFPRIIQPRKEPFSKKAINPF